MVKILLVFGTRPEAIKLAPVVLKMRESRDFSPIVAVTAQHRELLDQVLEVFNIKPDYDLDIMEVKQSLSDITIQALRGLTQVIKREQPDMVVVHGDTTTTFSGALASFYTKIPVAHVEAGLRSNYKREPFPEEVNRTLTSVVTDLHLAPTMLARQNLLREGVSDNNIIVTGNTVIDALIEALKLVENQDGQYGKFSICPEGDYLLLEVHRRENWGVPMREIFLGVRDFLNSNPGLQMVFSVHPNPLIKELSMEIFGDLPGVHLISPPGYLDFVRIMRDARLIVTDSGGIQEESSYLKKQVVLVRRVTERPEAVESGFIHISGVERNGITKSIEKAFKMSYDNKMITNNNPFGDGNASSRIVAAILWFLGFSSEKPQNYLSEGGQTGD
ncbi:MAG: UDP-N-acetylglucosamine 2-epimerase [candidate division WS2 bacterium]|nr:UDP-N-acetylglucosamine 2-epimerase [Candidatus Lithacetigena glycinireducens]